MMRKITSLITTLLLAESFSVEAESIDYPENPGRPRIFVNAQEMSQLEQAGRSPLSNDFKFLLKEEVAKARQFAGSGKMLEFVMDASGRRILEVSREALKRIFSCAFAYRVTGDAKYAEYAENLINCVCDFPSWNPTHFLDVSEMSLAVSVGYDWLYDVLSPETRTKAADRLYRYCIQPSLDEQYTGQFVKRHTNWNQVCHAGIVAAAIAIYDEHPDEAKAVIERAIQSNTMAAQKIYSPDGVYPEGAGYWTYGTSYQIALNTLLQSFLGSDFGLSDTEGFSQTWKFFMYSQDNLGKKYDYSEGSLGGSVFPEAWYFADRFGDTSCLFLVHRAIQNGKQCCVGRMSPLNLVFASRYKGGAITPPEERVYTGRCNNSILVARTGWEREDQYLGLKAGYGAVNHGHLDVGSFMYESQGVRWISEIHLPGGYSVLEKRLKEIGANTGLFNSSVDSWRWKIFSYSNKEHSTLTINDKIHNPKAQCDICEVIDQPDRIGGSIDLTPLFKEDAEKVVRTVVIKNNSYLEITDEITARETVDANVRFNLVTPCDLEIGRKAITLYKKSKGVKISAKGADVKYTQWSAIPSDYPNEVNSYIEKYHEGWSFCGYTYTVPRGQTVKVITIIKNI